MHFFSKKIEKITIFLTFFDFLIKSTYVLNDEFFVIINFLL